MPIANKPMPTTGVDYLHFADIVSNVPEAIIYAPSERILGQVQANYAPNSTSNPFYADNGAYINDTSLGSQDVALVIADLQPDVFARLIGGTYNGALAFGSNIAVASRGLLYRVMKAGQNRYSPSRPNYRYFRYWSGTCTTPNMNATTKGETVEYQTQDLTYSAVNVSAKNAFLQMIDDNDSALADMGISPEMLEEEIVNFNWDPFTGNPAFEPTQMIAVYPQVIRANISDGELRDGTVYLGLTVGEYVDTIIAPGDITATNLPAGITVTAVSKAAENVLAVTLTGPATDHTAGDSVNNVTFEVAQTAIVGAGGPLVTGNVSVHFVA